MSFEAAKAGLQVDSSLKSEYEVKFHHQPVDLRDEDYIRRVMKDQDPLTGVYYKYPSKCYEAPLHDELSFWSGWSFRHVCNQRIMNLSLSRTLSHATALRHGQREIPEGAAIHGSAIRRMRAIRTYRPSNVPLDTFSISKIEQNDLKVQEHFLCPATSGSCQ